MCIDNYLEYNRHKPPHRNAGKFFINSIQKYNSCCDCMPPLAQAPMHENKAAEKIARNAPEMPFAEAQPENRPHSDSGGDAKRGDDIAPPEKERVVKRLADAARAKNRCRAEQSGLLHYRSWWERIKVDISVQGRLISGTPIFMEENTLRVINDDYSYFIPLAKVDYIRTTDGLLSCFRPAG